MATPVGKVDPERELIAAIIQRLGLNVRQVDLITNSHSSLVCKLTSSTGSSSILKIPSSKEKASREVEFLTRLKHLRYVARVLDFVEHGNRCAFLMQMLPGMPLSIGTRLEPLTIESIGEALAAIHGGCTKHDAIHVVGDEDWWREKLRADTCKRLLICRHLTDVDWNAVYRLYESLLCLVLPNQQPSLVHADFRLGNLLAEGCKLRGVIDFESSHIGSPHVDLIRISDELGGLHSKQMRLLLTGYGRRSEPPEDLSETLPFYQIHNSIACVAWSLSRELTSTDFFVSHLTLINRHLERATYI